MQGKTKITCFMQRFLFYFCSLQILDLASCCFSISCIGVVDLTIFGSFVFLVWLSYFLRRFPCFVNTWKYGGMVRVRAVHHTHGYNEVWRRVHFVFVHALFVFLESIAHTFPVTYCRRETNEQISLRGDSSRYHKCF